MIIPILMYHSLNSRSVQPLDPFTLSVEQFTRQMATLAENGYTTMNVSQFIEARQTHTLRDKTLVLTFDDGLADFYTEALPVLQRYKQTATLYVTTGYIGETSRWIHSERDARRPMLTWSQIRTISDSGIEIGAHSHTHRQLDIMPVREARDEITRCKFLIEQHLGRPVQSFAYPHGYHNALTCQLVKEAGYTSACAVKYALSSATDDRFALARIIIRPDMDMEQFERAISGKGWPISSAREQLQTTVWRQVRWFRQHLSQVSTT